MSKVWFEFEKWKFRHQLVSTCTSLVFTAYVFELLLLGYRQNMINLPEDMLKVISRIKGLVAKMLTKCI